MLLAEVGCVFLGFILYTSGVNGKGNIICALKGSSVNLSCSVEHPNSRNKWYTVHWNETKYVQNELPADGRHVMYNVSEKSQLTLTINDLRESDTNNYCCQRNTVDPKDCWLSGIILHVTDLQVKVIPTTEEQTVSLMCSTSCPLTEIPAAYIWYKNREFLYQDWSPWYQQLVSSEEAVTYSCAIKGYEDLRASEVSVDSVTSTCFTVTYAKGRMCSNNHTSVDKPCSITYPREVNIQKTSSSLTCITSCPLTDNQTAYRWYQDRQLYRHNERQQFLLSTSAHSVSCAVKGLEDLPSPEVCVLDNNCRRVNYVSRRICALQGSSVNISSEYSYPDHLQPQSKFWYKIKRGGEEADEKMSETVGHVEYHDNKNNHHILRIINLKKNDSAEYIFRLQTDDGQKQSDNPGVTLVVTGLRVKFTPPTVVTEGQRVTLTCITSCPLSVNTTYNWYLNSRPLTLLKSQTKHLILDPVSSQHAGKYSCAVKTHNISSSGRTLTVQSIRGEHKSATAAGVCAVLLVIIPLVVFFWIRRKRTSGQSPTTEATENTEQLHSGPLYENISAQPTQQDDHHYGRLLFSNHTEALYSTINPGNSN
ncbi:uncharacterized protein LOC108887217 [Lates japonicus]